MHSLGRRRTLRSGVIIWGWLMLLVVVVTVGGISIAAPHKTVGEASAQVTVGEKGDVARAVAVDVVIGRQGVEACDGGGHARSVEQRVIRSHRTQGGRREEGHQLILGHAFGVPENECKLKNIYRFFFNACFEKPLTRLSCSLNAVFPCLKMREHLHFCHCKFLTYI
jgi:hypothetical protein